MAAAVAGAPARGVPGRSKADHDGSDGNVEDIGGIAIGHALHIDQEYGAALRLRQVLNLADHLLGHETGIHLPSAVEGQNRFGID